MMWTNSADLIVSDPNHVATTKPPCKWMKFIGHTLYFSRIGMRDNDPRRVHKTHDSHYYSSNEIEKNRIHHLKEANKINNVNVVSTRRTRRDQTPNASEPATQSDHTSRPIVQTAAQPDNPNVEAALTEDELVAKQRLEFIRDAHMKLGHAAADKIYDYCRKYYQSIGLTMIEIKRAIQDCQQCVAYSRTSKNKASLPNAFIPKGFAPLDVVYSDTGFIFAPDVHKQHAFQVIIDDYSNYRYILPMKDTTAQSFIQAFDTYMSNFGKVNCIRSDLASGLTSHAFRNYCKERNIELSFVHPNAHQSNAVAESSIAIAKVQLKRLISQWKPTTCFANPTGKTSLAWSDVCTNNKVFGGLNSIPINFTVGDKTESYSPSELFLGRASNLLTSASVFANNLANNLPVKIDRDHVLKAKAEKALKKLPNKPPATRYAPGDLVICRANLQNNKRNHAYWALDQLLRVHQVSGNEIVVSPATNPKSEDIQFFTVHAAHVKKMSKFPINDDQNIFQEANTDAVNNRLISNQI